MHSKFIIIDEKKAYGGSYNFTTNARSNFENFKLYAEDEVMSLNNNFKEWISRSIDFFHDLLSPEKIVEELLRKFASEEKRNHKLIDEIKRDLNNIEHSFVQNKVAIIDTEIRKQELRNIASSLAVGQSVITENGHVVTKTENLTTVKPHKFYGGRYKPTFNGRKSSNSYAIALLQKKNIENKYKFIKCRIDDDTLICKGVLQTKNFQAYTFKLEFRAGDIPQVYIISPSIENSTEIHVYKEGCLCLFYPPDMKWKNTTNIAEYTIPWVIEWIYLYELWKLTGKWEAPEVKHN
jgi:hypothetical protein